MELMSRYRHKVHGTGRKTRLVRESLAEAAAFGSAVYSKVELIAEMGGAYLFAEAGISTAVIENQAAVHSRLAQEMARSPFFQ